MRFVKKQSSGNHQGVCLQGNIFSRQSSTIPAIVNDNTAHKLLEENTDDFFSLKRKELNWVGKNLLAQIFMLA